MPSHTDSLLLRKPYPLSENPWDLLSILLPVASNTYDFNFLKRTALENKWTHFTDTCHHVEEINWVEPKLKIPPKDLFDTMKRIVNSGLPNTHMLLPKINQFHVACFTPDFLRASVHWICNSSSVIIHVCNTISDAVLVESICFLTKRLSHVSSLEIVTQNRSRSRRYPLLGALVELVRSCQWLVHLSLSFDLISTDVVAASSTLPLFETLHVLTQEDASPMGYLSLNPSGVVHIASTLALAARIIPAIPNVPCEISIKTKMLNSPDEMRDALGTIVQACPRMHKFRLVIEANNVDENPSWICLSPLLRCAMLTEFHFSHPYTLRLKGATPDEITLYMVRHFPAALRSFSKENSSSSWMQNFTWKK